MAQPFVEFSGTQYFTDKQHPSDYNEILYIFKESNNIYDFIDSSNPKKKMSNTYWNNDKTSKINIPTKYKRYKTGSVNNANILYLKGSIVILDSAQINGGKNVLLDRKTLSDMEEEDFSPSVKQDMKTDIGNLGVGIYKKKTKPKTKTKTKRKVKRRKNYSRKKR
jgi:hypothetical protein